MLLAALTLGIIAREFYNAFYVVQEVLIVLSFTALGVFFAASLMILAIVSHSAWQNLMTYVRKTITRAVLQERLDTSLVHRLVSRGVYERENRIKA